MRRAPGHFVWMGTCPVHLSNAYIQGTLDIEIIRSQPPVHVPESLVIMPTRLVNEARVSADFGIWKF